MLFLHSRQPENGKDAVSSAPTGARCQEGSNPSQAKALRACNRMLLRHREVGWGAQEVNDQSVRKELDSAVCIGESAGI